MHRGERVELVAHGSGGHYRITHAERVTDVAGAQMAETVLSGRFNGRGHRTRVVLHPQRIDVHDGDRRLRLEPVAAYRHDPESQSQSDGRVMAPMPGRVVVVKVKPGDRVILGQELLVVEAMKMELALKAPRDGTVAEVRASAGDFIEADAVLAVLSPLER